MHYKGHQVGILSFVCNKEKRIQSRAQNKCFFVGLRNGRGCGSGRDARQVRASEKIELHASQRLQLLSCLLFLSLAVPLQVLHRVLLRLRLRLRLLLSDSPPSYRRRKTTLIACTDVGAGGRGWCRYDKAAA